MLVQLPSSCGEAPLYVHYAASLIVFFFFVDNAPDQSQTSFTYYVYLLHGGLPYFWCL